MNQAEQEKYIAIREMSRGTGWKYFCDMLRDREGDKVVEFRNCERFDLERLQGAMIELEAVANMVTNYLDEYETSIKEEKENA